MSVRAGTPAARTRAQLAREHRFGRDPGRIEELRRQLRADQLADHIVTELATQPPLTSQQRAGLAALLTGKLPDGTWSCTRDHANTPCGDCDGCRHAAAVT